jgi:hypothetical protein
MQKLSNQFFILLQTVTWSVLTLFVLWKYVSADKVSIYKCNKSNFILIHLLFVGTVGKNYYEIHVATHTRVRFEGLK